MSNPKTNRRRGKENETALAKRLGGKRVGLLGKENIEQAVFSIETKSLERFAGERFLEQAEHNASADKTPIAIIHIKNKSRDSDIVMMRLKDWEEQFIK